MREQHADTEVPAAGKEAVPYPRWREIVNAILKHGSEMYFGSTESTGSDIVISDLPFDPAAVVLINQTGVFAVHTPTMTDGDAYKVNETPTSTFVTTGGVTLGDKQFTIGTDADVNPSGSEKINYVAIGARDIGTSS